MGKSAAKPRRRRHKLADPLKQATAVTPQAKTQELAQLDGAQWKGFLPAAILFGLVVLYAYWPTLVWIEDAWRNEPDYSHGYLVPLLAGLLCWHRKDLFPGVATKLSPNGLWLIGLAIVMRFVSRLVYADFLDAWSLLPLIAGAIWFLLGFAALRWCLPAVLFLFLMIPMPYQAESLLSWKLQGTATQLSTAMLRVLGQPAVSEGHVIWLGEEKLLVEQACSGMRIFIGVAALAFFWAAMVKRTWIDRLVILALVVPLAVFVNAVRITVVGLLYKVFSDEISQSRIHDISGYLMIPFAFGLLWLAKTYWEHLYRPLEQLTAKDFVNPNGSAS